MVIYRLGISVDKFIAYLLQSFHQLNHLCVPRVLGQVSICAMVLVWSIYDGVSVRVCIYVVLCVYVYVFMCGGGTVNRV